MPASEHMVVVDRSRIERSPAPPPGIRGPKAGARCAENRPAKSASRREKVSDQKDS